MADHAAWEALHQRVLSKGHSVWAEVSEEFFPILVQDLSYKFPGSEYADLIDQAASDALMNYLKKPQAFDPQKSNLCTYLCMSADGDLRNARAKQQRREKNVGGEVDFSQMAGNGVRAEEEVEAKWQREVIAQKLRQLFPQTQDLQIAELIIEGEKATETYAQLMQITHLPKEEQQKQVHQAKDRIKKKLQRQWDHL